MTGTIRALTQANAARLRQRVTEVQCASLSFVSSSIVGVYQTVTLSACCEHFPRSNSRR